jgi:hypothetical protein
MNTIEDSVALLAKASNSLTEYRTSLDSWRSAMTDLTIWQAIQAMQADPDEYYVELAFTPEVIMAWILRDNWQHVSIDEDGYDGIDNAVKSYLIDNKLAKSTDPDDEEEDDE